MKGKWGLAMLVLVFGLLISSIGALALEEETESVIVIDGIEIDEIEIDEIEIDETETEHIAATADDVDVYNLLLIGSDRRVDTWNGNSDVMVLITLNKTTNKVIMTSFMRDLYADIPEYGVHKLNYAYAAGGAETLIATLEDNYDISIDNYVAVDFESMAAIIDMVGGVDLEVSEDEAAYVNLYLTSMEQEDYLIDGGGEYHFSGWQCVAYMRIRFVGNGDYQRTQRQRDILLLLVDEVKDMSLMDLFKLARKSLALADYDIGILQLLSLIRTVVGMDELEIVENRVPYDDLYTSQGEMLVPDFEETIALLHEVMYE